MWPCPHTLPPEGLLDISNTFIMHTTATPCTAWCPVSPAGDLGPRPVPLHLGGGGVHIQLMHGGVFGGHKA